MKRLLVLLKITGDRILTKSSPRGFARKETIMLDAWLFVREHKKLPNSGSHIEAIMLAKARWCSGNHTAASLVGEKTTSG